MNEPLLCRWLGHWFVARYSEIVNQTLYQQLRTSTGYVRLDESLRLAKAATERTYIGEVCTRCGKAVTAKPEPPVDYTALAHAIVSDSKVRT